MPLDPLSKYSDPFDFAFDFELENMVFINELIPEEEKSNFDFPVRTVAGDKKPTLYKWVIDKEKGAYLVLTHSYGEGTDVTEQLVLVWQGKVTELKAEWTWVVDEGGAKSIHWKIFNVRVPPSLESQKEEVLNLIAEAFDARSWPYRREKYESVDIDIAE